MIPNSIPNFDFSLGDTADMLRDSVRIFARFTMTVYSARRVLPFNLLRVNYIK